MASGSMTQPSQCNPFSGRRWLIGTGPTAGGRWRYGQCVNRLWWIVVVASALIVGSCGDPTIESTGGAKRGTDDPVLFDAGTPIGDGFVVPTSSVALTQPITPEHVVDPSSWTVELVPDDPIDAMNDLVAQANRLGFELGGSTPTPCVYDNEVAESGTSNQEPWPPPASQTTPRSISCGVAGYRASDGVADRLWMTTGRRFIPSLGQSPGTEGSISIERLSTDTLAAHDGSYDYEPVAIAPLPDTFPPSEEPADPPKLTVGDSLIPTAEPGMWEVWEPQLVEGSRLVAPTHSPICQGGFASVLDITGSPDAVMAGYTEQIRAWSAEHGQPPTTSEILLFKRRVIRSEASIDGTSLSATMVIGLDGEPTRMNYTTCSG